MKNLLTICLFASTLLFVACGDDDEGVDTSGNGFTYQGEFYATSTAYIIDYGANGNGSFDVDLYLTSGGLNLTANTITNANFAYLDLNTSMEGVLEAGTYTFADERDVFVMVDGSIAINFSADSNGGVTSGSEEDITTGTATVSVSGSTYTINYTLNIGNETATGVHTGSLTPVAVN